MRVNQIDGAETQIGQVVVDVEQRRAPERRHLWKVAESLQVGGIERDDEIEGFADILYHALDAGDVVEAMGNRV
jgi:hypothetical protein